MWFWGSLTFPPCYRSGGIGLGTRWRPFGFRTAHFLHQGFSLSFTHWLHLSPIRYLLVTSSVADRREPRKPATPCVMGPPRPAARVTAAPTPTDTPVQPPETTAIHAAGKGVGSVTRRKDGRGRSYPLLGPASRAGSASKAQSTGILSMPPKGPPCGFVCGAGTPDARRWRQGNERRGRGNIVAGIRATKLAKVASGFEPLQAQNLRGPVRDRAQASIPRGDRSLVRLELAGKGFHGQALALIAPLGVSRPLARGIISHWPPPAHRKFFPPGHPREHHEHYPRQPLSGKKLTRHAPARYSWEGWLLKLFERKNRAPKRHR